MLVPAEARKVRVYPRIEITKSCELPYGCCESNIHTFLNSLEGQQVLLTAEPSFHLPPNLLFRIYHGLGYYRYPHRWMVHIHHNGLQNCSLSPTQVSGPLTAMPDSPIPAGGQQ